MLEKLKPHQEKLSSFVQAFQDVRAIGLVTFLVIALLITWSGVKVIETNYGLQRSIAQLRQEIEVQKLENRNLELQNEFYGTDEYLELEARKNFGLAAPGETVLVVPKHVALAQITPQKDGDPKKTSENQQRSNFDAWIDFFFHR